MEKTSLTTKTKMADAIHFNYQLIPIIGRFGIDYGFGNKTIERVCEENNINAYFFLEILNSFQNKMYFPNLKLQNFTAKVIIKYLSNTHTYYLDTKVPEIQYYISEMVNNVEPEAVKVIKLLDNFFKEYKDELVAHLKNEDDVIYPYVLLLEKAVENAIVSDELMLKVKTCPIEQYERNHDDLEVKLNDLKNLIIKFLPSMFCDKISQKLLTELFRLEADIVNHTKIEEQVLVPKVKQLEKKILECYAAN